MVPVITQDVAEIMTAFHQRKSAFFSALRIVKPDLRMLEDLGKTIFFTSQCLNHQISGGTSSWQGYSWTAEWYYIINTNEITNRIKFGAVLIFLYFCTYIIAKLSCHFTSVFCAFESIQSFKLLFNFCVSRRKKRNVEFLRDLQAGSTSYSASHK